MKKLLYIEPTCGIAGDMFVASALELISNRDKEIFFERLNSLPISEEFEVEISTINKNSISANNFTVKCLTYSISNKNTHRNLDSILSLISNSKKLTKNNKSLAKKIFVKLAEAEAEVHNCSANEINFHEVGAIDSIVDIVSSAILYELLQVEFIFSKAPALGNGYIKCAHGNIPAPSPATIELLKDTPVKYTDIETELTTPTGAAILTTLVDEFYKKPEGKVITLGYGAGKKDLRNQPNILRLTLLEDKEDSFQQEKIQVIECTLDDFSSEHFTFLGSKLLRTGALDYSIIPATMKKNRQGFIIQVICKQEQREAISKVLLEETSTLGIRYRNENREFLNRRIKSFNTPYGQVRVKLALGNHDETIKFKPEQNDILKIAESQNINYFNLYRKIEAYIQNLIEKKENE